MCVSVSACGMSGVVSKETSSSSFSQSLGISTASVVCVEQGMCAGDFTKVVQTFSRLYNENSATLDCNSASKCETKVGSRSLWCAKNVRLHC